MERVAAVLFVKNEAEDIPWWIGWHLSIGIDTIVIYDDYSTDGTWEVINAAAKQYDVRPRRAVQTLRFNHRQAQTYMAALDELREEFDWLVYLDADEYLDILNGETVHTFLSRYPDDVDAIAMNWKCFGSNRHVEKPPSPNVFGNYITHSEIDFELNQCVKSFFRPKRAETGYINPHRFAVPGRYITPNGEPIEWQQRHDERPVAVPDWSKALVRHFITRSVEHFVAKSKRRSDIRAAKIGIGLFYAYDRNELYDPMPGPRVNAMYPYIYGIQNAVSVEFLSRQLKSLESKGENMSYSHDSSAVDFDYKCLNVETVHGDALYASFRTGAVCNMAGEADSAEFSPLLLLTVPKFPDHVFLTVIDRFVPLCIGAEPRVSTILSYEKIDCEDNGFALRNPLNRKIICFTYTDTDKIVPAVCDREWISDWETLKIVDNGQDIRDPLLANIAAAISACQHPMDVAIELDMPRRADATVQGLMSIEDPTVDVANLYKELFSYPWMKKDKSLSL